jgi:ABC-type antimicrobial peptide transport system permease subunit
VIALVAGAFAALALVLAALGLYGVLAHAVARRTPEIGVRRALGAPPASVLGLVIREGLVPAAAGAALGLAAAFFLTRGIASLLYGLTPADPGVFAAIAAVLLAVAAAACVLPARRAMRVDPMIALRGD